MLFTNLASLYQPPVSPREMEYETAATSEDLENVVTETEGGDTFPDDCQDEAVPSDHVATFGKPSGLAAWRRGLKILRSDMEAIPSTLACC